MEISVNDQLKEIPLQQTLLQLLQGLQCAAEPGIAAAVNDRVISATGWAEYVLQENDAVLIITATQGG